MDLTTELFFELFLIGQYSCPTVGVLINHYKLIGKKLYWLSSASYLALIFLAWNRNPATNSWYGVGTQWQIVVLYPIFLFASSLIYSRRYSYSRAFALTIMTSSFIADAHEWFGQLLGELGIPVFWFIYTIEPLHIVVTTYTFVILAAMFIVAKIDLDRYDVAAIIYGLIGSALTYALMPNIDALCNAASYPLIVFKRLVWFLAVTAIMMRKRAEFTQKQKKVELTGGKKRSIEKILR